MAALELGFVSKPPALLHDDSLSTKAYLESLLEKHSCAGVSVAVLEGNTITSLVGGVANKARDSTAPNAAMKPTTWLQQASLSKTVGAAYMVTYYQVPPRYPPDKLIQHLDGHSSSPRQAKGVSLTTPVVDVLKRCRGSPLSCSTMHSMQEDL